jgi:hypothetical protein
MGRVSFLPGDRSAQGEWPEQSLSCFVMYILNDRKNIVNKIPKKILKNS